MHAADMTTILMDLVLILVLARLAGWAAPYVGMPPVVGEIIAGILLGPSILGPDLSERLFPMDARPYLSLLANIGLVLFMFVVGLELDVSLVRGRQRVAGAVSISSILLPFALGIGLAAALASEHNQGGDFWPFALFMGAAMSVTAFPVLARILTDRNMHRTETGGLALACAAADDVLAWTLLAVVIGISGGAASDGGSWVVALAIPFAVVALFVVRPQLNRLTTAYNKAGRLTSSILSYVLVGLLTFAAITEYLHVHFIFGAFLFGAIMPQENAAALRRDILVRLEQLSVLLLLPVFFLVSGLNVNLRGLSAENLVQLAVILAVAIGGKFVGAYVGARLSGVRPWQARALGILMNTRGLTELVILNVGRELGLINDTLFTMLVVMAVVTTMMTGPLLRRAYPDKRVARDIAEADRAALGDQAPAYRVMVVARESGDNADLLDTAIALVQGQGPAEVALVSIQPQSLHKLALGSGLTEELAEISASMERMEQLVRRGEAAGVTVRVRSHLSTDPASDLAALVEALAPQTLVVSDADPSLAALLESARCVSIVQRPGAPSSADLSAVRARWQPDADGDAAVVAACKLAANAGCGVLVEPTPDAPDRKVSALRKQLAARGFDVLEVAPMDTVLTVSGGLASEGHLQVRAEPDPVPVEWASEPLGDPSARQAGVTSRPDGS